MAKIRNAVRTIIRSWPTGLLAAVLFGLGWALFQALPVEPRWRISFEKTVSQFDFHWEADGRRVRVKGSGHVEGHHMHVFEPPFGRWIIRFDSIGPAIVNMKSGSIEKRYGDVEYAGTFHYSSDGRYAVGSFELRNVLRWIDFAQENETEVEIPRDNWIHWHKLSREGDWLLVGVSKDLKWTNAGRSIWAYRTDRLLPEFEINNTLSAEFVPHRPMIVFHSEEEPPGLHIWDLEQKQLVSQLPGASDLFEFSRDGTRIATTLGDNRSVWDISDPAQPEHLFSSQRCYGSTGVFSPDGGTWAIWKRDNRAELWDTRRAKKSFELAGITDPSGIVSGRPQDASFIVFSPDSRRICTVSLDSDSPSADKLRVHDVATGALLWELASPQQAKWQRQPPGFTADSRRIVMIDRAKTLRVLDADSGDALLEIPNAAADLNRVGKFALIRRAPVDAKDASWLRKILDYVLPKNTDQDTEFLSVLDLDALQIVTTVENRLKSKRCELSPDGMALLVAGTDPKGNSQLICWDVPAARPWRWLVGVPIGLGLGVMLLQYARKIRRRRVAPS